MSEQITHTNVETVRKMIDRKISSSPYMASNASIMPVINDMDHHPYDRRYRGVYYYPDPIVMERETGWRKQEDKCYDIVAPPIKVNKPHHCWQAPCSTIFPCYPQYLTKYADDDELNVLINNSCITQYR